MHLRWSLGIILAACSLTAQTADPNTQLLLDHAKADRDSFGAGHPRGLSLEDQVRKNDSDLHFTLNEDHWLSPDSADPNLLGTAKGADMFLARMLKENDVAVTGKIVHQISIFNTNKTKIVTDSLLIVDRVFHAKPGFDVHPGSVLVIARLGGREHIDNHQVQIDVNGFSQFINGASYVLFLRGNQQTDSYLVEPDGALLVDQENLRSLNTKRKHPAAAYLERRALFLDKVQQKAAEVGQ